MRDLAILAVVFGIAGVALLHPWVGVLGWTWVSIMNPHRMGWGFAYDFPVAAVVAGATLAGLVITRDHRSFPVTPSTVVLALFVGWLILAWTFSMFPQDSTAMLSRVLKIQLMVFVALTVIHSRRHINLLIWVLAVSLGFFGVKGGTFTILSGGSHLVWGPSESFISGNNELALALVMTIPLMRYLQLETANRWIRRGLLAAMLLCAASAVGSHSRGALLAIAAMAAVLWFRSHNKLFMGSAVIAVGFALLAFMPQNWHERMATIDAYEEDESARGRFIAWETAWNVARDRFFGAGFDMYRPEVFSVYSPIPDRIHAAHSIYFQVLGEHGFIALGLFLVLWFLVWRDASWLRKNASQLDATRWAAELGSMCQVSLVGYCVGGAFLSLSYFDLPYNILIVVVTAKRLASSELERASRARAAERAPGVESETSTARTAASSVR